MMPRAFCLMALVTLVAGCATRSGKDDRDKPLVVASFSVLADLAKRVGGDEIEVVAIVGPDSDAHTHNPTPADVRRMAEADIVLELGAGFESGWLDRLCVSSGTRARRIVASDGIALIRGDCRGQSDEPDPHVWHDPTNAAGMAEVIGKALSDSFPWQLEKIGANSKRVKVELEALDEWIKVQISSIPPERRKIVTSHDTFGYFGRRYGIRVAGTVLPSFSTEYGEPSAAEFSRLAAAIRAEGVPAIFADTTGNPALAGRLAEESGVLLGPPLYTDSLGPPGSPGATYDSMMRHNTRCIVEALSR
jgi:ABC-type Zn uptake system ZnuABC Zn-binding protein ZnuA